VESYAIEDNPSLLRRPPLQANAVFRLGLTMGPVTDAGSRRDQTPDTEPARSVGLATQTLAITLAADGASARRRASCSTVIIPAMYEKPRANSSANGVAR
jgi:hypothetical protein